MKKANQKAINKKIYRVNLILIIAIISEIILKFLLIIRHKIGWDEFYFLSKVHLFQSGQLTRPFQTFHVYLLGWVPWMSGNEVSQIIAARCFLYLLFIVSGILLYLIARQFISRTGALFSVFCWLSLSNIIWHGSSLRADSFCAFLFLLACFALLKKNRIRLWAVVAGIAMGISLLISIKAAIHLVSLFALLVALWLSATPKKLVFLKSVLFISLLTLTYSFGFNFHQEALASATAPTQQDFVHQVSSKVINVKNFFPRLGYFLRSLKDNLVTWVLLGMGVFNAILGNTKEQKDKSLIFFSFLVPLLSLPFYRNAFPYYYVFVIAPAVILCGILPHNIIEDFRKTGSNALLLIFAFICLPIACSAGIHYLKALQQDNSSQAELLSVIHKMFPEPVPYIDGCSSVASYPKVGFFMSTWGFENYLATEQPVFRQILQKKQPQFLLANTPHLDLKLPRENPFFDMNYDFLPEDKKTLEENFVRYWGLIWLPGKTLYFNRAEERQNFEILISGPYIIESANQVILDNELRSPGEQVTLSAGKHMIQQLKTRKKVVLRWNKLNYTPQHRPHETQFFYGF